jgi:uncharacterized membrane protein YkvA (DUF1232 family)
MKQDPNSSRHAEQAARLLKKPKGLGRLAAAAQGKIRGNEGVFGSMRKDLERMLRLTKAWATGKYKDVSPKSLVIIIAAFLYLIDPFDFIPDFTPVLGLTDDLTIFSLALRRLKNELNKFEDWESELTIKPED